MNLNSTEFGVVSLTQNRNILDNYLQIAEKLGWIRQSLAKGEIAAYFTTQEGAALKANHYWGNPFDYASKASNFIDLDTNYNKAKYMLQIIGKNCLVDIILNLNVYNMSYKPKVGDRIQILTKEELHKKFKVNMRGEISNSTSNYDYPTFVMDMYQYCGRVFIINNIYKSPYNNYFTLNGARNYSWAMPFCKTISSIKYNTRKLCITIKDRK